jgi:hypothetical protein
MEIMRRAKDLGLGLKLHADEMAPLGGAELAAELGALSADHLLQASEKGGRGHNRGRCGRHAVARHRFQLARALCPGQADDQKRICRCPGQKHISS